MCRGNVIFGFEQANKYTVLNERGETVALLAEELGGIGRSIGRQLLRTRRPMTATVLSPDGESLSLRQVLGAYTSNCASVANMHLHAASGWLVHGHDGMMSCIVSA